MKKYLDWVFIPFFFAVATNLKAGFCSSSAFLFSFFLFFSFVASTCSKVSNVPLVVK